MNLFGLHCPNNQNKRKGIEMRSQKDRDLILVSNFCASGKRAEYVNKRANNKKEFAQFLVETIQLLFLMNEVVSAQARAWYKSYFQHNPITFI